MKILVLEKMHGIFFACMPAEASRGKVGAFLGLWHLSRYRRQMTRQMIEIAVCCNENEEEGKDGN